MTHDVTHDRTHGLVDFPIIPHPEHPDHPGASLPDAQKWAARSPSPTYAIDDDSAVKVVDGVAEVVSEGRWKLFQPSESRTADPCGAGLRTGTEPERPAP